MDDAAMQNLAMQFNLSETTFVLAADSTVLFNALAQRTERVNSGKISGDARRLIDKENDMLRRVVQKQTIEDPYQMPPKGETLRQYYERREYLGSFDDLSAASLRSLEQERKAEIALAEMAKVDPMVFWEGKQGYIRYPDGSIVKHGR